MFRRTALGILPDLSSGPSTFVVRDIFPKQEPQRAARSILKEIQMRNVAVLVVMTSLLSFSPASADALTALDPDKDGTVDLAEAQAGATKVFAAIDPDKDGTLDAKEIAGRLDAAAADPDKDGTVDAKEYAGAVAAAFKAADPDAEGTVDGKELASDAGKALLKLIQ